MTEKNIGGDFPPHMCQDGHPPIRHWDSENEQCPLCRALNGISDTNKAHARYEYVRRLNVPQFKSIFARALKGERFDDIIDACMAGCTPQCREDEFPGCAICMGAK